MIMDSSASRDLSNHALQPQPVLAIRVSKSVHEHVDTASVSIAAVAKQSVDAYELQSSGDPGYLSPYVK